MHNSCHKCCTNVEYSQHDLSSCDCVGTACLCCIQTLLALKHHGPLHVLLLYMCLQLLCLSIEKATNSAIKLRFLLVLGVHNMAYEIICRVAAQSTQDKDGSYRVSSLVVHQTEIPIQRQACCRLPTTIHKLAR